MSARGLVAGAVLASGILCTAVWGQAADAITLVQAQQIALRNHPRVASAALAAEASGFVVKEVGSAYYPTLTGNVTDVAPSTIRFYPRAP